MKKQLSAIILAGILGTGLLFTGCGAGSDKYSGQASEDQASNESYSGDGSYSMGTDDAGAYDTAAAAGLNNAAPGDVTAEEAEISEMAAANPDLSDMRMETGEASLSGSAADTAKNQNEKLIFTYNYSVETKEFDAFYEKISDKTTQLGGYVENSETNGSAADGTNRYATLTLRIPADQMDQMVSLLNSESNITYQSRSSENVTLQYVDMESHLKALRTEQKTLLQLMEKADKLKDVISLQSQLTEVRYEIESYESQLRMYDNLVEYSTLYLNITEVERTTNITSSKTSFFEEVRNTFSDNVYAVGQSLRSVAIWLIGSLPVLVPLGIAAAAVIMFLKKRIRRRTAANAPETDSQNTNL